MRSVLVDPEQLLDSLFAAWTDPKKRSFTMVGRLGSVTMPVTSAPQSVSMLRRNCPLESSPTTLSIVTSAPIARRFAATKPALPSRAVRSVSFRTGIGASGDIRATTPDVYRSTTSSPATMTRTESIAGRINSKVCSTQSTIAIPLLSRCGDSHSSRGRYELARFIHCDGRKCRT
jgi:hypothetical protein